MKLEKSSDIFCSLNRFSRDIALITHRFFECQQKNAVAWYYVIPMSGDRSEEEISKTFSALKLALYKASLPKRRRLLSCGV